MTTRDDKRAAAIEAMADHVLAKGMAGASLRPLAAAAGTSNRMLLYYFADKDELLTAVLGRIAERLLARLDRALPPGRRLGFAPLLAAIWPAVGSSDLQPFMRVWLELVGGAAHGRMPDAVIAPAILAGFAAWVELHLDAPATERAATAALLLATIDGMLLLDAAGRRDLADAAVGAAGS